VRFKRTSDSPSCCNAAHCICLRASMWAICVCWCSNYVIPPMMARTQNVLPAHPTSAVPPLDEKTARSLHVPVSFLLHQWSALLLVAKRWLSRPLKGH
jgi:hypothetical protein